MVHSSGICQRTGLAICWSCSCFQGLSPLLENWVDGENGSWYFSFLQVVKFECFSCVNGVWRDAGNGSWVEFGAIISGFGTNINTLSKTFSMIFYKSMVWKIPGNSIVPLLCEPGWNFNRETSVEETAKIRMRSNRRHHARFWNQISRLINWIFSLFFLGFYVRRYGNWSKSSAAGSELETWKYLTNIKSLKQQEKLVGKIETRQRSGAAALHFLFPVLKSIPAANWFNFECFFVKELCTENDGR